MPPEHRGRQGAPPRHRGSTAGFLGTWVPGPLGATSCLQLALGCGHAGTLETSSQSHSIRVLWETTHGQDFLEEF